MSLPRRFISRDQVSEQLAVAPKVLLRYEARGLIRSVRDGDCEGYEVSEIRKIWSVVSLHRDLGINLAGVEAIVKLREQMLHMQSQVQGLADRMQRLFDERADDATE